MKNIDKQKLNKVFENTLYSLLSFGLILAVWALVAYVKNKPLVFPMPDVALREFFALIVSKGFWLPVGWTLALTLICFVISFVLAFALAVLGGIFRPFHKVMTVFVSVARALPTMAIILVIMLWLDDRRAAVVVGFLVAFPLLYQAVFTAIVGVDKDLIEMAKLYKVKSKDIAFGLYVPEIAPAVFDASASTISLTLKVIIAAEVLTYCKDSIGLSMQRANTFFDIPLLMAWTVAAVVLSFALEGSIKGMKALWRAKR